MTSNGMACWIGGLSLIALTIAMHSIALVFIALLLVRLRRRVARSNLGYRSMLWFVILGVATTGGALAFLHAAEIAIWAISYVAIGAMGSWTDAVLYSIDSMTTRGASGLEVAEEWRLMGALEAADGMLLFGISTAFLFAVAQQISPMLTGAGSPRDAAIEPGNTRNREP
jgi:hypothetical protein